MQNMMKATLVVNGKEFPIEINDPKLIKEITPKEKTGYERVVVDESYYYMDSLGGVVGMIEELINIDNLRYEVANYYSNMDIAQSNTRADTLMRKLRRFAVEHREKNLEWVSHIAKSYIYYDHNNNRLAVNANDIWQTFGSIYFDSKDTAELAIEKFKDELIWYFTEYKDSL